MDSTIYVSGSGTSGQVAYFNGTSSITGESNLFWDATNDRLGIGTNSPNQRLEVNGRIRVSSDGTNGGDMAVDAGGLAFSTQGSTPIAFWRDNYTNHSMRISAAGRLLINNTNDEGFTLDVNGTGRFSGSVDITGTGDVLVLRKSNNVPAVAFIGTSTNKSVIEGGDNFDFYTGNIKRLTIASTGAATFSSSVSTPHTTKTANYTLTETDYTVGFDCASNRTATLPDATTCAGRIYVIYQYNTGSGARSVTLDGNGSQTINGVTTYSLAPYCDFTSVVIQSNGSNWIIISSNLTVDCL